VSRRRAPELPEPTPLPGRTLGLLSDSHADEAETRRAVELLCARGADTLLHLGDLCSPEVIERLAGAHRDGNAIPARLVFGNMDLDEAALARHADRLGVACDHPIGVYEMDGALLVAHHGHHPGVEAAAIEAGAAYYLHGHTHRLRDERAGQTRLINPGALHRASRHTCALLAPGQGRLEILDAAARPEPD